MPPMKLIAASIVVLAGPIVVLAGVMSASARTGGFEGLTPIGGLVMLGGGGSTSECLARYTRLKWPVSPSAVLTGNSFAFARCAGNHLPARRGRPLPKSTHANQFQGISTSAANSYQSRRIF